MEGAVDTGSDKPATGRWQAARRGAEIREAVFISVVLLLTGDASNLLVHASMLTVYFYHTKLFNVNSRS